MEQSVAKNAQHSRFAEASFVCQSLTKDFGRKALTEVATTLMMQVLSMDVSQTTASVAFRIALSDVTLGGVF